MQTIYEQVLIKQEVQQVVIIQKFFLMEDFKYSEIIKS